MAIRRTQDAKLVERATEARRARRFALQVPVRYRVKDEPIWQYGRTANISKSGMLLRTQLSAQRGTVLELRMSIPVLTTDGTTEVIGRGVVVRSVLAANGELPALAVRILYSRLTHG
jgi:hypothetical protein